MTPVTRRSNITFVHKKIKISKVIKLLKRPTEYCGISSYIASLTIGLQELVGCYEEDELNLILQD